MTTEITPPSRIDFDTDGRDADQPPRMPFLHMWTDIDGTSHVARSAMTGFGMKSVGGPAAPQWMRPFPGEVSNVIFTMLPAEWVGDWHESPAPQWVIPLKGRWFIETQDGARVEMGPGDIHFGQDLGTEPQDGNKGHLSGSLDGAPCYQMIVQFASSPGAATKDPF